MMGLAWLHSFIKDSNLAWKRVTCTIRTAFWPTFYVDPDNPETPNFSDILRSVTLPASCKDVTLELECLADPELQSHDLLITGQRQRDHLQKYATICRQERLYRRDGVYMDLDEEACMEYTWKGSIGETHTFDDTQVPALYHVWRICWQSKDAGTKRERMRYDYLDCLNSDAMKILPRST
jgi:hypothetical protein